MARFIERGKLYYFCCHGIKTHLIAIVTAQGSVEPHVRVRKKKHPNGFKLEKSGKN